MTRYHLKRKHRLSSSQLSTTSSILEEVWDDAREWHPWTCKWLRDLSLKTVELNNPLPHPVDRGFTDRWPSMPLSINIPSQDPRAPPSAKLMSSTSTASSITEESPESLVFGQQSSYRVKLSTGSRRRESSRTTSSSQNDFDAENHLKKLRPIMLSTKRSLLQSRPERHQSFMSSFSQESDAGFADKSEEISMPNFEVYQRIRAQSMLPESTSSKQRLVDRPFSQFLPPQTDCGTSDSRLSALCWCLTCLLIY